MPRLAAPRPEAVVTPSDPSVQDGDGDDDGDGGECGDARDDEGRLPQTRSTFCATHVT